MSCRKVADACWSQLATSYSQWLSGNKCQSLYRCTDVAKLHDSIVYAAHSHWA